jgi:uncharacterized protein (TIGR02594 family)
MMEKQFEYLLKEGAPKVLVNALRLYGTAEIVGSKHNPIILDWAKGLGLEKTYSNDEIPWCGLFVAHVVKLSGFEVVKNPLWARNWAKFGTKQKVAMLGDVLTFVRNGGGHVGFYVGENKDSYFVLGGNQSNRVNIAEIAKSRCISINRCTWKIKQPANVRQIFVDHNGVLSTNEQ